MTKSKEQIKITKLYGIAEKDGMYQVVTAKVDLENKVIIEALSDEAVSLESARVQFKVHIVRNVLEGLIE